MSGLGMGDVIRSDVFGVSTEVGQSNYRIEKFKYVRGGLESRRVYYSLVYYSNRGSHSKVDSLLHMCGSRN